ncbi:kinesin-like protein KIF20B isoform X2 [Gigantopelta aegis]|uniref:kinesin-like protein KIF20B isoform X2 n=1 Tax=Gigantopelta aegis TaxID=1735272 RepID=UPI001B88DBDA|nr:kinesin-like protein KIF20B isoform X2 [Gigantopelta aegis]
MSGRKRMFTDILEDPCSQSVVEDDVTFVGAKKNLLETFDKNELLHLAEHMKVYLRIRPFFQADFDRNDNQNCFKIENEYTLITSAPKDSHTYRNFAHGLGKTSHKFTFSKIFPQETTQKLLFDTSMLGLVQNFIEGQNCLVFTYGITSSGKTYTIQGKPRDAGVLPRTLDVLFNSIDNKQCSVINHKPMMFMDVSKLTASQVQDEKKIKEQVLKMCTEDDHDVMTLLGEDASDMSVINSTTCSESSNISSAVKESVDSTSDLFMDLENRVREETAVSVTDQGQIRFSVWVSFAEIYNEQIFDLLEPIPKKKNARRPILGLRDDKNGSPYIKGLKEICVTNADEAYKLLTVGQKNLKMACTKLNHNSSRSHCIFNIKIIRVSDCHNPHFARVSMLSLCDLAGSERSSKTHATGDRLKEAGNINTSLMTLGRCIDILRHNQMHKEHPKIVPFRESKLTRLFQNFFCGRGKAAMIVNVNQCGSMFDETLNVLKFSAIAKQVVVVQKPDPKPKVVPKPSVKEYPAIRPSIPWEAPTPRTMRKMNSDLQMGQNVLLPDDDSDLEETDQEIQDLLATIRDLENKLLEEKHSKFRLEARVRQEVCEEMMKQIVEIEDECSERIREKEMEKEEMRVKLFMSSVHQRKRRRKDDDDDDDEMVSSMLLHAEQVKVEECNKKLDELQSQIVRLNKDVETLTQEKTSLQFQLADVKRTSHKHVTSDSAIDSDLVKELKEQLNKALEENSVINNTLLEQESKIKDLTEMLEEAAETFEEKEEEIAKLKAASQDDEERLQQQADALRELRTGLANSNEALEESKTRLGNKNERLAQLENQVLVKQGTSGCTNPGPALKCVHTPASRHTDISHLDVLPASPTPHSKHLLPEYYVKRTEQNRVLRVVVTPLQMFAKHTKTSLMRMRSPLKRGDTVKDCKRKLDNGKENSPFTQKTCRLGDTGKEEEEKGGKKSKDEVDELQRQLDHLEHDNVARKSLELDGFIEKKERRIGELDKIIASKDLELEEVKLKLKKEEEESAKRDQALIHGYTAEINSHKSQLVTLKSKMVGLENKLRKEESIREDLNKQIRALKAELDKTGLASAVHEHSTQISKSTLNDLEKRLEAECTSHCETRTELSEMSKVSSERLEELTVMTQKHQELETRVKELGSSLSSKNEKLVEADFKLEELKAKLEYFEEENKILKSEMENLMKQVVEKQNQLDSDKEDFERTMSKLKSELTEKDSKIEQMEKRVEELVVVNTELRGMISQTTDVLNSKDADMKDQHQKLLAQHQDLEGQFKDKSDKLHRTELEVHELKSSLTSKQMECESLSMKLLVVKEKLSSEEAEIHNRFTQQLKEMDDQFKATIKDLQDKLISKEKEFSQQMTLKEKEVKEIELKLVTREEELHNAFNQQQNQLGNLLTQKNKEFDEKLADYDRIVKDLEGIKQETANIEKKWLAASQEVKHMQTLLEEDKFERVAVKSELENKVKQCEDLEVELSKANHVIEALKTKEISFDGQIGEMKSRLEEKTSENSDLARKCCELKVELQQLQTDLVKQEQDLSQKSQTSISSKEKQCMDLEDSRKQLQDELAEKKATIEKIVKEKEKHVDMFRESEKLLQTFKDKMESVQESLLKSKDDSERRILRLQDELSSKERELENVHQTLNTMKSKLSDGDAHVQQLNSAVLEIAELRSALHMEETLHNKYKQETTTLEEKLEHEVNESEARRIKLETLLNEKTLLLDELTTSKEQFTALKEQFTSAENEWREMERKLNEENKILRQRLNDDREHIQQKMSDECRVLQQRLNDEREVLENMRNEIGRLKTDFVSMKEDKMKAVSSLQMELDRVNEDLLLAKQTSDSYRSDLERLKDTEKSQCSSVSSGAQEGRLSELTSELEIEKKRNAELERMVESYRCEEVDMLPGSSRRLRKEKIEIELKLMNVQHELELLKSKLESRTASEKKSGLCSSSSASEKQLQERLAELEHRLAAKQSEVNSQCEELAASRKRVLSLEEEVQSVRASAKDRELSEISRPTTPSALSSSDSLINDELQKSQNRESKLSQQLKQASGKLMENMDKITELEESLSAKELTILELNDRLKTLLAEKESASRELDEEMRGLQEELKRKSERLEVKSSKVKDLERTLESERERFELALKDAKANENLMETLKTFINEQEETMQTQDAVLKARDEEVQSLQEEKSKQVDRQSGALASLKEKLKEKSFEVVKLEKQKADVEKQLSLIKGHLSEKDEELQEKSFEVVKLEKQKADVEKQLSLIKGHLSEKDKELQEKSFEVVKLEKQKADVEKQLSLIKGHLSEKDKEIQEKSFEVVKVEKQKADVEKQMSLIKGHLSKKDEETQEKSFEVLKVEKQMADIEKQLSSMKGHLSKKDEEMKEKSFEVLKLQKQKTDVEKQLSLIKGHLSEKDEEMQSWRQNRDELVGKLETLLKSQAVEIKELKKKVHHLRDERQALQRQTEISLKASEAIICDLKTSNSQLQEQVAKLQGIPPAPVFVNDEIDTMGHININATPPSAVKGLKKSLRKRCHQLEGQTEQIEDSTERRPKRKAASIAKGKIMNIISSNSPITRSDFLKPRKSKNSSEKNIDVDSIFAAAQNNETPELPKKGSKKRQLYKEKISAPFDCAPFMPSLPETPETVDVHEVVHRQLRGRGKAKCPNTAV